MKNHLNSPVKAWVPTSLLIAASIAIGHAEYSIAANAEAVKKVQEKIENIVELQRRQANTNGKIEKGVELLIQQNQLIQQRLWELQNNKPPTRPER